MRIELDRGCQNGSRLLADMVKYGTLDAYLSDAIRSLKGDREDGPEFVPLDCLVHYGGVLRWFIKGGVPSAGAEARVKKMAEECRFSALEFGSDDMDVTGDGLERALFFTIR